MWGQPQVIYMTPPQQNYGGGYPGNDVRFIPVPNGQNNEAIKILKKELKDLKKKSGTPDKPKADEKKPRVYTFLETLGLCMSTGLFVFMLSSFFTFIIVK